MPTRSTEVPSLRAARLAVAALIEGGLRDVVLCPGSRSAPLVYALVEAERRGQVRLIVRTDERVAGFLALGLALVQVDQPIGAPDAWVSDAWVPGTWATDALTDSAPAQPAQGAARPRPVAVVTTSGTATANLHPAVMEASMAGVPLVIVTADRPAELHGVGANQTVDQTDLYGPAVRWRGSLAAADADEAWEPAWRQTIARAVAAARGQRSGRPGPVHLNIEFRDPLAPRTWNHPADDVPDQAAGVVTYPVSGLGVDADASADTAPDLGADLVSGSDTRSAPDLVPDFSTGPMTDQLAVATTDSARPDLLESSNQTAPPRLEAGPRTVVVAGSGAGRTARDLAEIAGWPLFAEPASGSWGGPCAIPAYRLLLDAGAGAANPSNLNPGPRPGADGRGALSPGLGPDGPAALPPMLGPDARGSLPPAPGPDSLDTPPPGPGVGLGQAIQRVVVVGRPTLSRPITRLVSRPDVELVIIHPTGGPWFDIARRARLVTPAVTPPDQVDDGGWLAAWQRAGWRLWASLESAADGAPTDAAAGKPSLACGIWAADGAPTGAATGDRARPVLTGPLIAAAVARVAAEAGTPLVVAASNSIRDLDLVPAPAADINTEADGWRVLASRGVAGIDGTISTAVGVALGTGRRTRLLIGDLAFLHDAGGLAVGSREVVPDLDIVVVNDGGGGIFETLEHAAWPDQAAFERFFVTPQVARLAALAQAYGAQHQPVETVAELTEALTTPASGGIRIIEVRLNHADRRHQSDRLRQLARRALGDRPQ